MAIFKRKDITIEAVQWNGTNFDEVMNFMQEFHGNKLNYENAEEYSLKTKELVIRNRDGNSVAYCNDWIIKGFGEFYPCKPDVFKKMYDIIN